MRTVCVICSTIEIEPQIAKLRVKQLTFSLVKLIQYDWLAINLNGGKKCANATVSDHRRVGLRGRTVLGSKTAV